MESTGSADIQNVASNQGHDNGQLPQQLLQTPTVYAHTDGQLPMSAVSSGQPQAHSIMQAAQSYTMRPPIFSAPPAQHYMAAPQGAYSAQLMQQQQHQNYTATQMSAMYRSPVPSVSIPSQQQQYTPAQVTLSMSDKNQYGFQQPTPGGYQFPPGSTAGYQFPSASAGVSPAAVRANFSPADRKLNVHVPDVTPKGQGQYQGQVGGSGDINTQVQAAVEGVIQSAYGSLVNTNIMNDALGRDLNLNVHVHVHSKKTSAMPTPAPLDATFAPKSCDPVLQDPALRAMIDFTGTKPPKIEEKFCIIESSDEEELKEEARGDSQSDDEDFEHGYGSGQTDSDRDTAQPVLSNQKKKPAFQCEICKKVFNNKRGLDNHIQRLHAELDAPAEQPDKVGNILSELSDYHTYKISTSPKKRTNAFRCTLCEKQLNNRKGLTCHLRNKHKLNIDRLEDTETVLKQKELKSGASTQTAKSGSKTTPERAMCTPTKAVHGSSGSSKQVFRCPICDKGYTRKIALMNHVRLGHKSSRYKTMFAKNTESESKNPVKGHHAKNKNQSHLKLNDESTVKIPENEQIIEIKDDDDEQSSSPRFRCELCVDKSFRLRRALAMHMKKKHRITSFGSATDGHGVDDYPRSTSPNVSPSTTPKNKRSTAHKGNANNARGSRSTIHRNSRSTTSRSNRSTTNISCRSTSPISSRRSTTPMSQRSNITISDTSGGESNGRSRSAHRGRADKTQSRRGHRVGSRVARGNPNSPRKRMRYDEEANKVLKSRSDGEEDLECNVCGYTFTHARELTRHVRLEHGTDHSDAGFDDELGDTRVHVPMKERPRRSLKKSEKTNEKINKAKTKLCQYCHQEFEREGALVKHESICSQAPGLTSKKGKEKLEKTHSPASRRPKPPVVDDKFSEHIMLDCRVQIERIDIENKGGDVKTIDFEIPCPYCSKPYTNRNSLRSHIERNHSKTNTCLVCKKEYTDAGALTIHIRRSHPKKFPYQCRFCYKRLRCMYEYKTHVKDHVRRHDKYRCLVCIMFFLDKETLDAHIRQVHDPALIGGDETMEDPPDEIAKLQCHICKVYVTYQYNLERHMVVRHNKYVPMPCRHCDRTLENKLEHMKHLGEKHKQMYPFCCLYCGRCFPGDRRQLFEQHKLSHIETGRPYYCMLCKTRYKTKYEYQTHMSKHMKGTDSPLGSNPDTMEEDQDQQGHQTGDHRSISTKAPQLKEKLENRKTGANSTHNKDSLKKELYCTICKRLFVREGFFVRHMKLHKRRCPHSSLSTTRSETSETQDSTPDIETSRRADLSGNKSSSDPLSCSVCGLRFSSPLTKMMHETTHRVQNKLECEKCNFKCDDKIAFDAHMHNKHAEETRPSESNATCETIARNETEIAMDTQDIVTSTSGDSKDGRACLSTVQSRDETASAVNITPKINKDQSLNNTAASKHGSASSTQGEKTNSDQSESIHLELSSHNEEGDVSSTNKVSMATVDNDSDFLDDSQDLPMDDVLDSDNIEANPSLSSIEATNIASMATDRACEVRDKTDVPEITITKIWNIQRIGSQSSSNAESSCTTLDVGSELPMSESLISEAFSKQTKPAQRSGPTADCDKNGNQTKIDSDVDITTSAQVDLSETKKLTVSDETVSECVSHRDKAVESSKVHTSKKTAPSGDGIESNGGRRDADGAGQSVDRGSEGIDMEPTVKDYDMTPTTGSWEALSPSDNIAVSKSLSPGMIGKKGQIGPTLKRMSAKRVTSSKHKVATKTMGKKSAKRGPTRKSSSTTASQDKTKSITTRDKPSSPASQDAGHTPSATASAELSRPDAESNETACLHNHESSQGEKCNEQCTTEVKHTVHRRIQKGGNLHKCDICERCFPSKNSLKNHSSVHSDEKYARLLQEYRKTHGTKSATNAHPNEPVASKKDVSRMGKKFGCPLCERTYLTFSLLKKHLPAHSNEKPYKCKYCDRTSKWQNTLLYHERTHETEKPLKCDLCDERFSFRRALKTHVKHSHTEKKPLDCDYCDKTFKTASLLKIHTRVHTGYKPYSCEYCDRSFSNSGALRKHMTSHTGEKPQRFACKYCKKSYAYLLSLKNHIRTHTGENLFKCECCDKSFPRSSSLRIHMITHSEERPFVCTRCNKSFPRAGSLKQHMLIHTGEKPHKCEVCGKAFTYSTELKVHTRGHTGEKPYTCQYCKKAFRQRGGLNHHVRLHTGDKPYKCHLCDKAFTGCTSLKDHMSYHTGDLPHKCQYCSKAFSNKKDLRVHTRTHTGEKPYQCRLCNKAFSQPSILKRHIVTHTGDKPYKCDYCDKAFSQSASLLAHIRTHTGNRPYKCDHCEKAFFRKECLNNHILTHTGEKPHKCDHCDKAFTRRRILKTHQMRMHSQC